MADGTARSDRRRIGRHRRCSRIRPCHDGSRGPTLAKDLAFMPSPSEHRLPFETPIYEMEARLGEMEAQYAKNRAGGRRLQDRRADPPPPPRAGRPEARDLLAARPLADRPGLAPPAAAPDPRLPRPDLRPVRRAPRRPRHRRRQGDRHRPGPPRRHEGHVRRPPEGQEPGRADRLQLRLRPPRGLPQGPAQDAVGRQVRPADRLASSTPRVPIRASPPRSGARRRSSPRT